MKLQEIRKRLNENPAAFFVIRFILIFVLLMTVHYFTRLYTAYFLITKLNAGVSAWIINMLTPAQQVMVDGQLLRSGNFVLTVARGCDGLDGMILLCSALIAYPSSIKRRLAGIFTGVGILYAGNLIRIVSLYYIVRFKPEMFDFFHIYVWQTLTIFMGLMFFVFWISRSSKAEVQLSV